MKNIFSKIAALFAEHTIAAVSVTVATAVVAVGVPVGAYIASRNDRGDDDTDSSGAIDVLDKDSDEDPGDGTTSDDEAHDNTSGDAGDSDLPPESDETSGVDTETDEGTETTDTDSSEIDEPANSDADSDAEDSTGPADSGESTEDTTGPADGGADGEDTTGPDDDDDTTVPVDSDSDTTAPEETETKPVETEPDETKPVHKHSYKSKKTDATCTSKGYTTYTCECGDTYKDNYVDALDHKWKAATCTEPKTCSRCGDTSGKEKGHEMITASCTEAARCYDCGWVKGDPLGHDWENAGCANGKKCTRCGETKGGSDTHNWVDGKCSYCGDDINNYINYKGTIVNPLTGEEMTVLDVLELTTIINKVGSYDVWGDLLCVDKVKITQTGLGRWRISLVSNAGATWSITECGYCHKMPCPDGGDEKCSEYDVSKDGAITCQDCGRPIGDGYNGTCDRKRDWDTGKTYCNHYDK